MSGTAPYYTEAFFPTPSRCFRPVSSGNEGGGPTHCPEPPTWRGTFRARNGRRYTVEACEGAPAQGNVARATSGGRTRGKGQARHL
jgi:hypothetical protein